MSDTKAARDDLWTLPIPIWVTPLYKVVSFSTFRDFARARAAHSPWWLNEQLAECESEVLAARKVQRKPGGYFLLWWTNDDAWRVKRGQVWAVCQIRFVMHIGKKTFTTNSHLLMRSVEICMHSLLIFVYSNIYWCFTLSLVQYLLQFYAWFGSVYWCFSSVLVQYLLVL